MPLRNNLFPSLCQATSEDTGEFPPPTLCDSDGCSLTPQYLSLLAYARHDFVMARLFQRSRDRGYRSYALDH